MAIHHGYPRKLYNTIVGDLASYDEGSSTGFDSRFDLARKMRAEKAEDPQYYKFLSEMTGINKKRIAQIARVTGDDAEWWEVKAIKNAMRLGGEKKRKNKPGR